MVSFLALYRGQSVGDAELVTVSTDPELVGRFADELLEERGPIPEDPVVSAIREGERRGLRIVRDEAEEGSSE